MDWIKDYQIFLFDFDGLLVDTESLHLAAYQELCRRRGFDLTWDFARFCKEAHGKAKGIWEGFAREFPDFYADGMSVDALYVQKKQIYVDLLKSERLELMEGAEEMLSRTADSKRAVVTNSPREHIDLIKEKLPILNGVSLWLTREDYSSPKPSPEGYLKALELLGEGRAVGFEDSLKGLKALLSAGVKGVLVCPSNMEHIEECAQLGAPHYTSFSSILDTCKV